MRPTLAALLLALPLATAVSAADEKEAMPEMTTYYFGMLLKGPNYSPEETPERAGLQKQHVAYLTRMHLQGHLVIAGPLLDDGAIRGLLVYKAASIDEARAWAEGDPVVKAGRLKVEMHPWMVRKGILP